MRVLVTGGCGFIGSNFVARLREKLGNEISIDVIDDMRAGSLDKLANFPIRVVPADLLSIYQNTAESRELPGIVKVFEGDFSHPLMISRIMQGFYDYVFHFAADPRVQFSIEHPAETAENNITKTTLLMQAAAGGRVRRFVFSSSSSVYGNVEIPKGGVLEGSQKLPESPYAVQKYSIELLLPIMSKYHDLDTVGLRYFNVYGPGHDGKGAYATAVAAWCNALSSGLPLRSDGDGTQSRDMVFVDDVADANIAAMLYEDKLGGLCMNVCTGAEVANNDILRMLWKAYGPYKRVDAPPRPGDVNQIFGSPLLAEETIGFKASVPFAEGLHKTMQWWGLLK